MGGLLGARFGVPFGVRFGGGGVTGGRGVRRDRVRARSRGHGVDALQARQFERAGEARPAALLSEDERWLKARSSTCADAGRTGGSIDQLTDARCLLTASRQRLTALKRAS